ncbi:hypothetical protein BGZ52_000850 [Haplosporangium bisporale]|nr:hypothetical protein BGZ52_000850 [Haplosporangium bisporale]
MRPKETTPLLHDSDTIVNLPSADEQLILFCVFEGECAMSTFSVKASYADTVDDLKKLPATEAVAVKVQSLDYHRFLRPTELLCEVFEDTVPRNTIHIVVDMMPTDPVHLRSLARVIGMAVGVGALFAVINILLSVYL